MLEQIFTKEFLTKARRTTAIILSLIKYVCIAIGAPFAILLASGVDAPDPYGSNTFKACAFCVGLCVMAMLIEMFVVRFLVKENEHIKCIFDFSWYDLKSYDNWKKYKRELREYEEKQRIRHENFQKMIRMANGYDNGTDCNVVQFNDYKDTVRYNNVDARRM